VLQAWLTTTTESTTAGDCNITCHHASLLLFVTDDAPPEGNSAELPSFANDATRETEFSVAVELCVANPVRATLTPPDQSCTSRSWMRVP
jgi:hypothetical protein